MSQPLISIIIPAYNVSGYLANCLDSVLRQTYANIEIMMVNDGSTDNTGAIADRFQTQYPDKLKVIHTDNRGVTMARFEGILASHGEWIGFVDGDDEIEPDMYERLYLNAAQYGTDISHCGYKTIVNGGERVHEFYNTGRLTKQDRTEGLRDFLDGKFEPSLWNKIFRRKMVLDVIQNNVISPNIKYNEDVLMNYYLFKSADSSVLEDFCGYHYLARTDSATRNQFNAKRVLDPVKVRGQILDDVSAEYKDIAERNYLISCMNAYAALYKRADYESDYKELKTILMTKRSKWHLLRKKDRTKLQIMMTSPDLYNKLYGVFERTLQKKVYE